MSGTEALTNTNKELSLDAVEDAIDQIRLGKIVIVVDDEDRENEGDFVCAAVKVTPEIINFMATYGRGLICAPIEEQRAQELQLNMMVQDNTSLHETAFTVSIDLLGQGVTTGISASDRAKAIKALTDPNIKPSDFAKPGHIFPLKAKSGGVLRRSGHTEAALDLARLAGFYPAGVLVEILNEDGTMARLPELKGIAQKHNLKLISIQDLIAFRMRNERIIKKEYETSLPSKYGDLKLSVYEQITSGDSHIAITKGTITNDEEVLVRVQSSTETMDLINFVFDENNSQIHKALERIADEGKGVLLYMRHGEKQSSLVEMLKKKDFSKESNKSKSDDQRDFGVGAQILLDLGVNKIRLLTNHPKRRIGLIGYGLEIVDNIAY